MSVYLIYFEKKKYPEDGNFSSFGEINKYVPPESWISERVIVVHKGKDIDATIFFDGVASSNIFFTFGNSHSGMKGEDCRRKLYDFITKRLKISCIQSYLYFGIFDGDFSEKIMLPDCVEKIYLDELDKFFLSYKYKGFFEIELRKEL